jgi:hypothetical protein
VPAGSLTTLLLDSLSNCFSKLATISYDSSLGGPADYSYPVDSLGPDWAPQPVLVTRLSAANPTSIEINYSQGPSCDPLFGIARIDGSHRTHLADLDANDLTIPGDGYVYVIQRSNSYFSKHMKFAVARDSLIEISQPAHFVGLNSTTNDTLQLFQEPTLRRHVATIVPHESLTVVLSIADDLYMIRNRFGILGWAKLPSTGGGETAIRELYYHGD